jgi:RHS repeat-associated protein
MPTTYNFTGQRLDNQTGLLYYNFRYYDPLSGRFARADTQQNNANGMDPYAYVAGNPETKNDPTGHCLICIEAVGVVLAVVITGAILGAIGGAIGTAIQGRVEGRTPSRDEYRDNATAGAIVGALTGLFVIVTLAPGSEVALGWLLVQVGEGSFLLEDWVDLLSEWRISFMGIHLTL